VLAKAAQAVMAIIKDPIGFLGKLVSAVGAGLRAFMANIASHLQKGLVSWLLGAAAKAGLQLPEKFDLKGILQLIGSLLGLTWAAIRGRIVSKGVPEQAMGAVESSVPMVQKIQSEGIGGIWEQLKEKVGDLKENLLGKIAQYLIPTVIIAGITWIVSLLNPASAFIKACKAIIDIVMFIVERGAQIMAFVNAVIDAVIAIAAGGAGGVPGLIETALVTAIPVLIGFLAALLGIGGLADKVKKLFQSLSKPVMKAVDWVVDKIVTFGKKLWAKLKSKLGQGKGEDRTPKRKERDLRAGLAAADKLVTKRVSLEELNDKLPRIRTKYHLARLELVVDKKTPEASVIHFLGEVNPRGTTPKRTIPGDLNVKVGDDIQVRGGSKWVAICQVTEVTDTHLQYLGHNEVGKMSGVLVLTGVNKSWRKYRPEAGYKVGPAFEVIRTLSTWSNFNDARQVLSYRAHAKFMVPPGRNWHHIHENSAGGAHSVANLALATMRQNQDFNVWFSRVQRGTGQLSVREFLRDQDANVHKTWGLDCIRKHGLSVRAADLGRGPYQEIV